MTCDSAPRRDDNAIDRRYLYYVRALGKANSIWRVSNLLELAASLARRR